MAKKVFKIIGIVVIALIVLVLALLLWLTATEYKPDDIEDVKVASHCQSDAPGPGDSLSVLSWNIGYCGLGKGSDFFMDGGKNVKSADKETVQSYLDGVAETLFVGDGTADVYMLQEVDSNSSRTYGINEQDKLGILNSSYALNYSCKFVPYPMPPIGKVNSGLLTVTSYTVDSAKRISLPSPFKWPVSTANLKRCMLVNYIPLSGTDKYLVMVNLHLEAYDDGEGKIAQTKQLKEFIQSEYEKGNYVIAGGDFNQEFPGAIDTYPIKNTKLWAPGSLDSSMIPEGWSYAYDASTPSCRLLNQPYDPESADTQYYVIDGFILSPNVKPSSVKTLNEGFENSDHNPVKLTVTLDK